MEKELKLEEIESPSDIKKLSITQLPRLCDDLRKVLLTKLSEHGGHAGPNLGVVEATVALHYVFNAPEDKIVFDVSHQTYIHKMLTGRMYGFVDPSRYDEISGYTSPLESPDYDLFEIGHTSTAIPLATGLAKARDMEGGKQNVVAFVGDASLGGGMALEALNYAPELNSNFIVVLNDNQRSIAENHGALYSHLARLRETNGEAPDNIFKALGYDYLYVAEGNNVEALVKAFEKVKGRNHAVVVHINTMKGDGYAPAEVDKESFHWTMPFEMSTGQLKDEENEDYSDIFASFMADEIKRNPKLLLLNAGTPGMLGLTPAIRTGMGAQYVDVGIAEQDAVAMAGGAAKGGCVPVMGVAAPFIQRAYDQLSHDVALNGLPAVFVIFAASLFSIRDRTHLGIFDIAMISNIPDVRYLAPASVEEYKMMLSEAVKNTKRPTVIRTPGGSLWHAPVVIEPDFDKWQEIEEGDDGAIVAAGTMLRFALKASEILRKRGKSVMVINPRNLSDMDEAMLDVLSKFKKVVTVEDGIADCGFGQKVAAALSQKGVKVKVLGYAREFYDRYDPMDVLRENGMTPEQLAAEF